MSVETHRLYVDWNNDGDFSDAGENISAYVVQCEFDRGCEMYPGGPRSVSGSLRAILRNSDARFSALNPIGQVKFTTQIDAGAEVVQWQGYVDRVRPIPGMTAVQATAELTAFGTLTYLERRRVRMAMQSDISTGDAVAALLTAVEGAALAGTIDTGQTVVPRYWVADKAPIREAFRELEQTETGVIVEGKDGLLDFHDRAHRLALTESQATFSSDPEEPLGWRAFSQDDGVKNVINLVAAGVRSWDLAANTMLWEMPGNKPLIPFGTSITLITKFPNPLFPAGAVAVNEWTSVDHYGSDQADGLGEDLSALLDVSFTPYATSCEIVIENISEDTDVYLTWLGAFGTAVIQSDTGLCTNDATDVDTAASIVAYGGRDFAYEGRFIVSIDDATDFCEHVAALYRTPIQIVTMTFPAHASAAFMVEAQTRDISDRITIQAGANIAMDLDADFFVERISHRILPGIQHDVTYTCSECRTHEWASNDPGYTPRYINILGQQDWVLPGAPVDFTVTADDRGVFTGTWAVPTMGNKTIDDYLIEYGEETDFSDAIAVPLGVTTAKQGTEPGAAYYFRLSAHNQSGIAGGAGQQLAFHPDGWGPWAVYGAPTLVVAGKLGPRQLNALARSQTGFKEVFEEDVLAGDPYWSYTGSGTPTNPADGVAGAKVLQAAGWVQAYWYPPAGKRLPYDPAKLNRVTIRVRRTATADAAKQVFYVWFNCLDNAGSSTGEKNILQENGASWTLNEWQERIIWVKGTGSGGTGTPTDSYLIPANSVEFGLRIGFNYDATQTAPAGNVIQLDIIDITPLDEDAENRVYLGLATNGVVNANKVIETSITDDSVTTNKILAANVTAGKISVALLSGISADLGTITAGSITSATYQTAASGQRVSLNGDGLTFYNSSGDPRFYLGADGVIIVDQVTLYHSPTVYGYLSIHATSGELLWNGNQIS